MYHPTSLPLDPAELRDLYHDYIGKYGKTSAVTAIATDYDCTAATVYRHLDEARIRAIRPKPQRPAEDDLRARCEAVAAEHGARAVTGKLAVEYGCTQVTVRQWMAHYGMRTRRPMRQTKRPIEGPCPCGAPATARYQGQDPPLCYRCYMRTRSADQAKAGSQVRTSRDHATNAKIGKPCTDCGGEFPPYVLHWDHVPERGQKLFNLGRADFSMEAVLAEIAKCDLVCANCHAVRTWNRRREQGVAPDGEEWLPVAGEEAVVTASAVAAEGLLF